MRTILLSGAVLIAASSSARADEHVSESVPITADTRSGFELKLGLAAGGPIGLVAPVAGVHRLTTEKATGVAYARIRLPRRSSRILELYGVFPNGIGVNLKNDDFRLGKFRFSVVDVGLFYGLYRPVSVRRVDRKVDLTVGTGVEYLANAKWTVSLDWRAFFPLNVPKVLTDYGDFARLIARESFQGGQLWLGFSRSW